LDVSVQAQIINLLLELQKEMGLTLLFISHDLSVVRHVSDRIAVMYLGQIVEYGDAQTIYTSPRHPYTQALISAIPIHHPSQRGKKKRVRLKGELPSPINPPKGCRFASRCPRVMPHCFHQKPEMQTVAEGQFVSCFLYELAPIRLKQGNQVEIKTV
ncbi:MAG: oligopeptide/dipeptide ABC transporter ATP-binding protein, partial [Vibrio sp.]